MLVFTFSKYCENYSETLLTPLVVLVKKFKYAEVLVSGEHRAGN